MKIEKNIAQKQVDNTESASQKTLLEFPCDFTIKAFGPHHEAFEPHLLETVEKHIPKDCIKAIVINKSKNGKYLAASITVHVDNKETLDNIYKALHASEQTLMVL